MAMYVALLRAVNVGGTGKLAMKDLANLCQVLGFEQVATYIQSGNVVFSSRLKEASVKKKLETALADHMGAPVAVMVRTAAEMAAILERNPFPKASPSQVLVLFLDKAPPCATFSELTIPGSEVVQPSGREVYVHYPDGMGRSKLKLPMANAGTSRNLNTVAKLAEMTKS